MPHKHTTPAPRPEPREIRKKKDATEELQDGFAYRLGKIFTAIDSGLDKAAERLGDATVESTKAFFRTLIKGKLAEAPTKNVHKAADSSAKSRKAPGSAAHKSAA